MFTATRLTQCLPVDEELALKLESELSLEKDMTVNEEVPQSVSDFLELSSFKVCDFNPAIFPNTPPHYQASPK